MYWKWKDFSHGIVWALFSSVTETMRIQMIEVCGNQLHKWKKKERMYPCFVVKISGYLTIYFKWKRSWRPDCFFFENCIWVVSENFVLSLVLVQCGFTKCWYLLFLLFFFYWLFRDASLKLKIKYAVFYFNVFCLCPAVGFKNNCKIQKYASCLSLVTVIFGMSLLSAQWKHFLKTGF